MTQPFTPQIAAAAFFTGPDQQILPQFAPALGIVVLDIDIWCDPNRARCPTVGPPPCNPPSDPGVIQGWKEAVQRYQRSGVKVLGYVPTDSGTGTPGLESAPVFVNDVPVYPNDPNYPGCQFTPTMIEAWIDRWYSIFAYGSDPARPDGIFLDEGPSPWYFNGTNTAGQWPVQDIKQFYVGLHQHVHSHDMPNQPTQIVMLNAAYYLDPVDWVLGTGPNLVEPAAEIALLWEGDWNHYSVEGPPSSHNFPDQQSRPTWWDTNPLERIAHTVYGCAEANICQAISLIKQQPQQRKAGYVYLYDGNSSAYDHLPPYWKKEVAAVVLRYSNDVYVRDWTDNANSYDLGLEPSAHPFWITSDVWNRLTNAPGNFNTDDQPANEDPQMDPQGNNTNYGFARIHRQVCDTQLTVHARFLWADFGVGNNFQFVSSTPIADVVFNLGDFEHITPGVQWSIPAGQSPHICLAVEVYPEPESLDPLHDGSLNGRNTSDTDSLITEDNNKAQRNLTVVQVPARSRPISFYAIVHNGDIEPSDRVLRRARHPEGPDIPEEIEATVEIISGLPTSHPGTHQSSKGILEGGDTIILEHMQPGENRWVGLTLELPEATGDKTDELQALPITLEEMAGNEVVNGFTIVLQLSSPSDMIKTNLSLHATEFRRLASAFGVNQAEEESEGALHLYNQTDISDANYVSYLQAHIGPLGSILSDFVSTHNSDDPVGVEAGLSDLANTLAQASDDLESVTHVHAQVLYKLDALITMLQKAQGDPADIVQTVTWQRNLYETRPQLKKLAISSQVVEESKSFLSGYEAGGLTNNNYPQLIASLLDAFHQTVTALGAVGSQLEGDIARMKQNMKSLAALQKAHRDYLLALQTLDLV